ncbi:MAG: hypothetical protein M3R48_03615 [Candidatus Dormibacteraeota bacterium]|nr:hypothetical protein [Candidatus Dormibacteraeota bacterium]
MLNAANASNDVALRPARGRLTREVGPVERFALKTGGVYRIAYTAGAPSVRRVSRSVVVFGGVSEHRRWDGDSAPCLDFVLPHGRQLSLITSQLVDVRPAEMNEHGQWVLIAQDAAARRRSSPRGARAGRG